MTTRTTKATEPLAAKDRLDAMHKELDAAAAEERIAQESLIALRELNQIDGDVTTEEYVRAGYEVQRTEDKRKGRETALAEAQQALRLEKLTDLRADIDTRADPAIPATAFEEAADALAKLVTAVGPDRTSMVLEFANQLRQLGVQPQPAYDRQPIAPEDDGFASYLEAGGGRISAVTYITGKGEKRNLQTELNTGTVWASLVRRACSKAGAVGADRLFNVGHSDDQLVIDPLKWFRRHS